MRKISDYLSKPLISLANASYEGTVIGFLCDRKLRNIEYLVILIEGETLDEKKYVATRHIKNFTDSSVTIANNACLKSEDSVDLERYTENPMNSSVYDDKGALTGKLTDVYFNDNDKQITEINVGGKLYATSKIGSASHDIIVLLGENAKPARKTAPRKIKKPNADGCVELYDKDADKNVGKIGKTSDSATDKNALTVNPRHKNTQKTIETAAVTEEISDDRSQRDVEAACENEDKNAKAAEAAISLNEQPPSRNTVVETAEGKVGTEQPAPRTASSDEKIENVFTPSGADSTDKQKNSELAVVGEVDLKTAVDRAKTKKVLPTRLVSDYAFLLGRYVTDNIYGLDKKLLIKKHCQVTDEIIKLAVKSGKLIELSLHSKR